MQGNERRMRLEAARSIVRALEGGTPFVRVGGEDGFLLCLRRRGEEIVDPDGHGAFEALSGGVFRRFRTSGPAGEGRRWMVLGPCDDDFLASALGADFDGMEKADLAAIPADMAFQSVRAQDAARRLRRDASEAGAPRPWAL